MKRILALHGVGSSGAILKDQLAPLIAALDPCYEFVYFDGAIERSRGPGMPSYYLGPFYSYTTGYSPAEIREALDDLDSFIQEEGPFDGIIGFSQGGSMAAAYLLDHSTRFPDQQPPFGFGVFLSSVATFSPDSSLYQSIIDRLVNDKLSCVKGFPFEPISPSLDLADGVFAEYLSTTFKVSREIGATLPEDDLDFFAPRDASLVPRPVHPFIAAQRITIPTVHVTGKADFPAILEQSQVVHALCDQSIARDFQHPGGHAAPSKRVDVEKLVAALEWAVGESANRAALSAAMTSCKPRIGHVHSATVTSRI